MKEEFSTFDIIKSLEIPRERLKDWMNKGFIRPSVPAKGQGTKAVFTLLDVYSVALFVQLITLFGLHRKSAAEFVERFKVDAKIDGNNGEEVKIFVLRYRVGDDGETIFDATTLEEGDYALDLKYGWTFPYYPDSDEPISPIDAIEIGGETIEPRYIGSIVINFSETREAVKAALAAL